MGSERAAASMVSARSELLASYVTGVLDAVLRGDEEDTRAAYSELREHVQRTTSLAESAAYHRGLREAEEGLGEQAARARRQSLTRIDDAYADGVRWAAEYCRRLRETTEGEG